MKIKSIFLVFLPVLGLAQMTTDRPGEGTGSKIIKPKSLQLESGVVYNKSYEGFSSDHLLRFGLTKNWELRLETDLDFTDPTENTYNFSSKYNFLKSDNLSPSLTLIGSSDFEFKNYSLILSSDKNLTKQFSIAANLGYKKIEFLDFIFLSSSLGYSFSDTFSVFAEYYGNYSGKLSPDHNADFGFSYAPTSRLKLDLSAGSSFKNVSENYFISTGISYIIFR